MSTLLVSGPLTPRELAAEASLSLSRARNLCSDFARRGLVRRVEAPGREVFAYEAKGMLPADADDIDELVGCYGLEAVIAVARAAER